MKNIKELLFDVLVPWKDSLRECYDCPFRQEYVPHLCPNGETIDLPRCRGKVMLGIKNPCEYRRLMR
ncbi:MAG: hypothetical protein LLF78_08790 [Synergistaceae bacterium]|nr:hypothetical protein [Synergistaceae bacterium]